MNTWKWLSAAAPLCLMPLCLMVSCAPAVMAPSMLVTAGAGKTAATFADDMSACQSYSQQQIAASSAAVNSQAVGQVLSGVDVVSAAQNAQAQRPMLQQQFDYYYGYCMNYRGDVVPGYGPVETEQEYEPHRRIVRRPVHRAPSAPSQTPPPAAASSGFVEPAPSGGAAAGGSGFVEPAPAAPAGGGSSFAVPPPAK
ncbi:MAG TPA: hypothetical protein VHW90_09945 [Stellaceae bacterium]|jgi:hypothetical protein|nr:hypothetical protein [Stellaceae bacterium]